MARFLRVLEANQHYSLSHFNTGNKLNFLGKTPNIKLVTEENERKKRNKRNKERKEERRGGKHL